MSRKTVTHTVAAEGRDAGKRFLITEMSATQGELFAVRAFLALARNGIPIPDGWQEMGFAALAGLGVAVLGQLPFSEVKPLMDELWTCVNIVPDVNQPAFTRQLVETDVEEIGTRLVLKLETLKLHFDFLRAVGSSISAPASAAKSAD
jgi:hypothetical protein